MISKTNKKSTDTNRTMQRERIKKRKSRIFKDEETENESTNNIKTIDLQNDIKNNFNIPEFRNPNNELNKTSFNINNISNFPDFTNNEEDSKIATNFNSVEKLSIYKYSLDAFVDKKKNLLNNTNNLNDKSTNKINNQSIDDILNECNINEFGEDNKNCSFNVKYDYKTCLKDSLLCSDSYSLSNFLLTQSNNNNNTKYRISDFSNNINKRLYENQELYNDAISNFKLTNEFEDKSKFCGKDDIENKNILNKNYKFGEDNGVKIDKSIKSKILLL